MRIRLWRWIVLGCVLAMIVAFCVHLAVDRMTREPPNYSQIEDGLWVGGRVAVPPLGCRAVLNLCESPDSFGVDSYKWAPIRDAAPVPTLDWLRDQVEYVDSQRTAGRIVFIHCQNGVSRSGMVAAAYLMWREHWSRDEALEFLRSRRPDIRPNPAFMELLLEWETVVKA